MLVTLLMIISAVISASGFVVLGLRFEPVVAARSSATPREVGAFV
jgi:hypothetical protein